MEKIISVTGACEQAVCDCRVYNGADPDKVGFPPFHDGCTCVAETRRLIKSADLIE